MARCPELVTNPRLVYRGQSGQATGGEHRGTTDRPQSRLLGPPRPRSSENSRPRSSPVPWPPVTAHQPGRTTVHSRKAAHPSRRKTTRVGLDARHPPRRAAPRLVYRGQSRQATGGEHRGTTDRPQPTSRTTPTEAIRKLTSTQLTSTVAARNRPPTRPDHGTQPKGRSPLPRQDDPVGAGGASHGPGARPGRARRRVPRDYSTNITRGNTRPVGRHNATVFTSSPMGPSFEITSPTSASPMGRRIALVPWDAAGAVTQPPPWDTPEGGRKAPVRWPGRRPAPGGRPPCPPRRSRRRPGR